MGTLLFERGVGFDQCFDDLNLAHPDRVESVHRDYLAAGAELIETNTFGANAVRLAAHGLEDQARLIARQGVKIARAAARDRRRQRARGRIGGARSASRSSPSGTIPIVDGRGATSAPPPRGCSRAAATASSSRPSRT